MLRSPLLLSCIAIHCTDASASAAPCATCVDTYPVKSYNLASAPQVDWYVDWRNSDAALTTFFGNNEGYIGTHMVYSIATSDGGVAVCGVGEEGETTATGALVNDAIVAKFSSTGAWQWGAFIGQVGKDDACVGMTQLPNGGDIVISGFVTQTTGVSIGMMAKLSLATGAQTWSTLALFPAASSTSWSVIEMVQATADGVLVMGEKSVTPNEEMKFHSYGQVPDGVAILYRFPLSAFTGSSPPTESSQSWVYSNANFISAKAAQHWCIFRDASQNFTYSS